MIASLGYSLIIRTCLRWGSSVGFSTDQAIAPTMSTTEFITDTGCRSNFKIGRGWSVSSAFGATEITERMRNNKRCMKSTREEFQQRK